MLKVKLEVLSNLGESVCSISQECYSVANIFIFISIGNRKGGESGQVLFRSSSFSGFFFFPRTIFESEKILVHLGLNI